MYKKKVDFSDYLFRPSSVGLLMTKGRGAVITDKQLEQLDTLLNKENRTEKQTETMLQLIAKRDAPPELSDTTIGYLLEVWIQKRLGRRKEIDNKYTQKGTWAEDASISLLSEIDKDIYFKNEEKYKNEFVIGTPDIVLDDRVIDIKSRWDIWTFMSDKVTSLYGWQLQAYMWLTGTEKATLAYTLVDTPEHIIDSLKRFKASELAKSGIHYGDKEYKDAMAVIDKNNIYSDIPKKKKVKKYEYTYDEKMIQDLEESIKLCRIWLNDFDKKF